MRDVTETANPVKTTTKAGVKDESDDDDSDGDEDDDEDDDDESSSEEESSDEVGISEKISFHFYPWSVIGLPLCISNTKCLQTLLSFENKHTCTLLVAL